MVDELDQGRVALPAIGARGGLAGYPRAGEYPPERLTHDDALQIVVGTNSEVIRVRAEDRFLIRHLASNVRDEVSRSPRFSRVEVVH
jgi:hypothetical protein